ncbi:MAG TPA: DUF4345 family protein [Caulobacteraceae bacterium]|nr:DUF4345 family protein [Caulobacteraceae bacterium]
MSVQLAVVAALFALMGIGAFVRPRTFVAPFGLAAETNDARNEIQAVYGGFGLAVAATLLAASSYPSYRDGVIVAVAASLAGMAGGRVVAALRERPGRMPVIFFFVEAALAALLLTAL